MQTSPREYYLSRIKDFEIEIANQKKKLGWLSFSRILTFILIIATTYFLFGNWAILIPIGLTVITLFLILIHRYNNLKREFTISKELLLLNQEEIEVLDWRFDHRDGGNEFIDTSHPFSYDIDLYGRGSFFQYMNRTSLESGKKFLSALLNSNSIEGIQDRQKSIIELQNMPDWRQRYSAISKLINDKFTTQQITNWIVNYNPFLNKAHYILAIVFTFISPILIVLTALQTVGPNLLGYWLLGGLIITGSQLKKINVLSDKCSKSIDTFQNYAHLIDLIEKREFSSKELQAQSFRLIYKNKKASLEIKKFSKILDAFDNRNNLISAIFGNGLFLYDLWQVRRIENWIKVNNTSISTWFEVVHFFDAYNSLGNFSFNHPNFNLPTVDIESENTISATNLGHPLIRPEVRISSDLTIQTEQFFIVTGANMAGKSTFLRSVSLFIIMANSGLPVCS
ncbi:MutS-related protein, partial [Aegicerativicinus sediminis]